MLYLLLPALLGNRDAAMHLLLMLFSAIRTMEKQVQQSISIGGPGYKGSMLYWGVVAVVAGVFLVTTITYWKETLRIIDENTLSLIEVKQRSKAVPD